MAVWVQMTLIVTSRNIALRIGSPSFTQRRRGKMNTAREYGYFFMVEYNKVDKVVEMAQLFILSLS